MAAAAMATAPSSTSREKMRDFMPPSPLGR